MSVKVIVSSEELKKTMEFMALISSNASGKKKDDDLKQMANALHIKAVSPYQDKNYMLMFGRVGNNEQLVYRMEGKSLNNTESAEIYVDCKKFMALSKTFTGDVGITFTDDTNILIDVAGSKYVLNSISTEIPLLEVPPEGGYSLLTNFLFEAVRFCSVAISREALGMRGAIEVNIAENGSAVCYGAQSSCLAKFVVPSTGCRHKLTLHMLPLHLQHIAELAEGGEIRLVKGKQDAVFVTAARFDYMCYPLSGSFFEVDRALSRCQTNKTISVNKSRLIAALARTAVVAGDDDNASNKVNICSDTANIYLNASSVAGNGVEAIPLDSVEGDAESNNYLPVGRILKIVNACHGESINISTKGEFDPLIIRPAGSESFYLVAPMRG